MWGQIRAFASPSRVVRRFMKKQSVDNTMMHSTIKEEEPIPVKSFSRFSGSFEPIFDLKF